MAAWTRITASVPERSPLVRRHEADIRRFLESESTTYRAMVRASALQGRTDPREHSARLSPRRIPRHTPLGHQKLKHRCRRSRRRDNEQRTRFLLVWADSASEHAELASSRSFRTIRAAIAEGMTRFGMLPVRCKLTVPNAAEQTSN
ncbi:hypothetical protein [Paraburkholderia sp.]|uniref:hypothetical protein n=1 Tax=Paraburkholderia sp. TaxID=1926495 RepID=UPI0039E2FC1E